MNAVEMNENLTSDTIARLSSSSTIVVITAHSCAPTNAKFNLRSLRCEAIPTETRQDAELVRKMMQNKLLRVYWLTT